MTWMYKFVGEKCDYINADECNIYPIQEEFPLNLQEALCKVYDFATEHPNGSLVTGNGHLVEYEVDGAELACYVDYR